MNKYLEKVFAMGLSGGSRYKGCERKPQLQGAEAGMWFQCSRNSQQPSGAGASGRKGWGKRRKRKWWGAAEQITQAVERTLASILNEMEITTEF